MSDEPKMVNGVLDRIARRIRLGELSDRDDDGSDGGSDGDAGGGGE